MRPRDAMRFFLFVLLFAPVGVYGQTGTQGPAAGGTAAGTQRQPRADDDSWTPGGGADVVVTFESDPVGATVEIDGEPVGETPCSRALPPGRVAVVFKLSKYLRWSERVKIKDGMPTVKARLEPNFGWLSVRTDPAGLKVELDGVALGAAPITRRETALGAHEIWVREPLFSGESTRIVIKRGEHEEITLAPAPVKGGLKIQAVDHDGNAVSADVVVDSTIVGRTWATLTVRAGLHEVEVRNESSRWAGAITVPVENVLAQDVTMESILDQDVTAEGAGPATNSLGMAMVWIKPGRFLMGSPQGELNRVWDEDQHEVTITRPFLLSAREVTQGQWEAVMEGNPSHFKGSADQPVEKVGWIDAVEFCNRLSARENLTPVYIIRGEEVTWNRGASGYRLPTEAEWEYACRAGTGTRYCLGDEEADLDRAGWFADNCAAKTHPVGGKTANAWGLYDMHGNVWEWCYDWYGPYEGNAKDPVGSVPGPGRVVRGGSWGNYPQNCRSALRNYAFPGPSYLLIGLRPVRPAD
jgi:formylglycine-generating enzyme required for sulfatase activity